MTGLAKFFAQPRLQSITLAHLIEHEVSSHQREWFARCQLDHTTAFPTFYLDIGRIALIGAVSRGFLPAPFWLFIILGGLMLAAAQRLFMKRHGQGSENASLQLRRFSALVLVRAVFWSSAIATCMVLAPHSSRTSVAMLAAFSMTIEPMSLIALPWLGLASSTLQAAAISGPLIWFGGQVNFVTAAIPVLSLAFVHSGLFHLNYMFATRRLRTRELSEKNEAIQLLLNHYHEDGSDWLFETDAEGRFINPSQRFCEAAQLSSAALTGKSFSDLIAQSSERKEYREQILADGFTTPAL